METEIEKEEQFSPEELEIVELPEREAMLKLLGPIHVHLHNLF
jgi:hypothetical protein